MLDGKTCVKGFLAVHPKATHLSHQGSKERLEAGFEHNFVTAGLAASRSGPHTALKEVYVARGMPRPKRASGTCRSSQQPYDRNLWERTLSTGLGPTTLVMFFSGFLVLWWRYKVDNLNHKFMRKESQRGCQGLILAVLCRVSNGFMLEACELHPWCKSTFSMWVSW